MERVCTKPEDVPVAEVFEPELAVVNEEDEEDMLVVGEVDELVWEGAEEDD
jgi:hypothetical protein